MRLNTLRYIPLLMLLLSFSSCSGTDTDAGSAPPDSTTVYFTGNRADVQTNPKGGVVMMGGGPENDRAMKWFLDRVDGGDVLVLRASGSDGYQDYFYSELGIPLNSVETIVFHAVATSDYILERISKAEGIWFAGGDQEKYLEYWKGNEIQRALQEAVDRGVVIGGTSAGMAILGEFIWDGERIQTDFLDLTHLKSVITDTHYDTRNRMPRHLEFISQTGGRGIAADEYTAIVVHPDGNTYVYGDEDEEDYAYFIREDLSVLKIKGSTNGQFALDLSDW